MALYSSGDPTSYNVASPYIEVNGTIPDIITCGSYVNKAII